MTRTKRAPARRRCSYAVLLSASPKESGSRTAVASGLPGPVASFFAKASSIAGCAPAARVPRQAVTAITVDTKSTLPGDGRRKLAMVTGVAARITRLLRIGRTRKTLPALYDERCPRRRDRYLPLTGPAQCMPYRAPYTSGRPRGSDLGRRQCLAGRHGRHGSIALSRGRAHRVAPQPRIRRGEQPRHPARERPLRARAEPRHARDLRSARSHARAHGRGAVDRHLGMPARARGRHVRPRGTPVVPDATQRARSLHGSRAKRASSRRARRVPCAVR